MKNKFTKTATLIIMFLVIFQSVYSQDYLITFTGSGQSNVVETIEVKNIAQQTTLTLSGTDTLLLTDVVGTGYLPSLNRGMIIYPNPANHSSRLEFYNSGAGNASIEVYDFSGRLLIHASFQLDAGSHAFAIGGLKAGIYLVKLNTPKHIYSQRLVSTSIQRLAPELRYEGITQNRPQEPGLKSISNIVAMQYNDGERLVFKAISGDYAHTKSLVPTESQHIDFEFMDCIDGDGNHYGVVTIGEQVWMTENLKTTKDADGNDITRYCYNNNSDYCNWYGGLYTWHTAMNGRGSSNSNPSGVQGICPTGWHVPSDAERSILSTYLGGHMLAGKKMKSTRKFPDAHPRWSSKTLNNTNESGWSGLPGGYYDSDDYFSKFSYYGYWWSSTEWSLYIAGGYSLTYNYAFIDIGMFLKSHGFSIRCLRD
jgi:uncharacterized protein (TIGR02145 family)